MASTATTTISARRKPLRPLSIAPPVEKLPVTAVGDTDDELSPRPRSLRNLKQLSITLPSAQSSTQSLTLSDAPLPSATLPRPRRPSVISLPPSANPTTSSLLHRKEEVGEPAVPYADGPIQIIPGIWLGSEDNARDWSGLMERGIKSVLNVAKEVASPFDSGNTPALRSTVSTPNLNAPMSSKATYHPPNPALSRPGMHYLKLMWSHGQSDLVAHGFSSAMEFTDAALARGEGVLVHCQCGISRSATLVIAIVMRAAAERSPSIPSEIWALKGMQGAYDFVKEKSKWIGPNMSLIYQLLEYEKKLKSDCSSPSSDRSSLIAEEEEEWGRRRRLLDEEGSDEEDERHSSVVLQEAQALDKAMEDRIVARKASVSSLTSSNGVGMGAAWRSRYGHGRKRTGSTASSVHTTSNSIISEDLVEEDEEHALLGVGHRFDESSVDRDMTSATNSPEEDNVLLVYSKDPQLLKTARPPPSAPVRKTSFDLPPPATAFRPTFNLSGLPPKSKPKKRPAPLGALPTVPSSPIAIIVESTDASPTKESLTATPPTQPTIPSRKTTTSLPPLPPMRARTLSRRPAPPPLHLRNAPKTPSKLIPPPSQVSTPSQSQTLFLFPPSPTLTARTPSTMTLMSSTGPVPFPSLTTPRVSTFRSHGRTRSFIGLAAPPTPTTGFSKVDVRGYVALE